MQNNTLIKHTINKMSKYTTIAAYAMEIGCTYENIRKQVAAGRLPKGISRIEKLSERKILLVRKRLRK